MPHTSFSGEDVLTVKLPNGYNIGIAVGDIESVEVTAKHTSSAVQRHLPSATGGKPTVAVLGTGGTIASYVDYRTGAVHPAVTAEELVFSVARVSVANLGEVVAVMHGETSDTFGQIHRGTKVRKMHSSRRDAFRSLNATPLGRVHSDGTVELTDRALPRARGPTKVDDALDLKVALASFYPGQPPTQLEAILEGQHGIVIAGTGLGHVAHDLIPILHRATRDGIAVVMTTQTLQGRV